MPRPHCCRTIASEPPVSIFKPMGLPRAALDEIQVTLDEYEALRLADLEGIYQSEAAERMGVSRATFGRVLKSAHRKVAEALTRGQALRIEGGPVAICEGRGRGRIRGCCPHHARADRMRMSRKEP